MGSVVICLKLMLSLGRMVHIDCCSLTRWLMTAQTMGRHTMSFWLISTANLINDVEANSTCFCGVIIILKMIYIAVYHLYYHFMLSPMKVQKYLQGESRTVHAHTLPTYESCKWLSHRSAWFWELRMEVETSFVFDLSGSWILALKHLYVTIITTKYIPLSAS